MHKVIICRGGAPVRHKLHIVCGCGEPRRLLIPLFLTSVKSHAAARRHKLRIACGCGEPRRLLTPLFLLWYNISVVAGRYHDRIYGYAYFCYNKAVMD